MSSNTFKIKRSDAKIKLFVLRSTYFLNFGKIINFLMFYLDNSKFLATKNLCWFFNIFHFSFSFLLEHTTSSIWKLNQFYLFSRFKSGWSWPKHIYQIVYLKHLRGSFFEKPLCIFLFCTISAMENFQKDMWIVS